MRSLTTAATGMQAQQLNVEVISNNLANMNTTAFQRQRAQFQDLLYQNVQAMGMNSSDAGTIVPTGVQVGLGVQADSIYRITEQGPLSNTDNTYDLAVSGRGYFRVQLPDGSDAYTRASNFALSPEGEIVTSDGYTVAPGIVIPQGAREVSINAQGQVQALIDGQTAGILASVNSFTIKQRVRISCERVVGPVRPAPPAGPCAPFAGTIPQHMAT